MLEIARQRLDLLQKYFFDAVFINYSSLFPAPVFPVRWQLLRSLLGNWGELIEVDVIEMDLQSTFDLAVSRGGVWVINDRENRYDLGTHYS